MALPFLVPACRRRGCCCVPPLARSLISRAVGAALGGLAPGASGVSMAVRHLGGRMSSMSVVQQQYLAG